MGLFISIQDKIHPWLTLSFFGLDLFPSSVPIMNFYKFYKNIMYFFPILELMFMNLVKYLYLIINGFVLPMWAVLKQTKLSPE